MEPCRVGAELRARSVGGGRSALELRGNLGRIGDAARAAVEGGALLDRQEVAVDVALDGGRRMQHDVGAADGAADAAMHVHGLSGDRALDVGVLADLKLLAVDVSLYVAKDFERALAAYRNRLA